MKAPSDSDDEDKEGANEDFDLDYAEFFSVLMYYGNMSKDDILHSSRRFLYGIFKQYAKRACENLGVSPNDNKDEEQKKEFFEKDYPETFVKMKDFKNTKDFLSEFKGQIPSLDSIYIDDGTAEIKEM